MKKQLTLTLSAVLLTIAAFASVPPISGTMGSCVGASNTLIDSLSGGIWSSSNTSIATIDSSTGVVTGVAAGTATITYSVSSSGFATTSYTVTAGPAAITGIPSSLCPGASVTLANATSGGTWSSSSPGVATINAATGVATGGYTGSTVICYTVGTGCFAIDSLYVGGIVFTDTIHGAYTLCVGAATSYTISMSGGTWSSSNPSVATISSSGVATGVSAGMANISYTITGSCGTAGLTQSLFVTTSASAGTISGTTSIVAGGTSALSSTVSGGTWSSSSASIASVNASTGVVTGVSAGTAVITYSVAGCGSSAAIATTTVTVSAFSGISGHILFTSGPCYNPIKVWLITYNTSTSSLQAVDSLLLSASGTSVAYSFPTAATDSYRVKAAVDSTGSSVGYVPTYHTGSYYWHSATVFYHTSGTGDVNKDITMGYGATTSGPGFISGNVTTGANKGTSTGAPAVGMLMYVVNTTTGTLIQQTVTDASGDYSFINLPVGQTYMIYPEAINYQTFAYTGITLTTASTTLAAADFVQHTISKTITPVTTLAVNEVNSGKAEINCFPNPTAGKINVQWTTATKERATIVITDVTGNKVFNSLLNMDKGTDATNIDISTFANGLYLLSIKSASINYNTKIQVQH